MMERKVELREDEVDKTKKFVRKNWPLALGIAGAAGLIGAAVWLTARYLREKKKREQKYDKALETVENEVAVSSSEVAALLESGSYLGKISGEEGKLAVHELASNAESLEDKQAFEVLREVIEIQNKK